MTDRDLRDHAAAAAREQLHEALLAEACGLVPSADFEQRVLAALRGRPQPARRPRRLVAALVLAGLAVVAAVASGRLAGGGKEPRAAAPGATQEPSSQDPEADAELAERMARLIHQLEAPARRRAVLVEIAGLGGKARPFLLRALAAERERGRAEIVAALGEALHVAALGQAKAKFGWPIGDPVVLIADYSDNRVVALGPHGTELWSQDEVYGVWDAELTAAGTLLLTEFSVSRVSEVDPKGEVVWTFEDLKNPYDADRLPDGNTLIADTFGGRVIEVSPKGDIVWEFGHRQGVAIRPFDVERLPNGNTLIADVLQARVLEVDDEGATVWQVGGMPNCHDADRLPNGNTLITLRTLNKVVEVDHDGKVVQEIGGLSSPSDADRAPDGTTLVAENGQVRIFDRDGKVVWKAEMTWAVEANRY